MKNREIDIRRGRGRRRAAAVAGLVTLSVAAPSASGAAGRAFLSPAGVDAEHPTLVMNAAGEFVVTWPGSQDGPVELVAGRLTKPFPPAVSLGDGGSLSAASALAPDGAYAVGWLEQRVDPVGGGNVYAVYAGVRPPGSVPGTIGVLAGPAVVDPERMMLAFGPQGQAVAGWSLLDSPSSIVIAIRPPGGVFSPPEPVYTEPSEATVQDEEVAFAGDGTPTVVWDRGGVACGVVLDAGSAGLAPPACIDADSTIEVATANAAGRFGRPEILGPGCEDPSLIEAASGAAEMVMPCSSGDRVGLRYAGRRSPGEAFGRPVAVAIGPGDDFRPSIAVLPGGRVLVAFAHRRSLDGRTGVESVRVELASGPIGGRLGRPVAVTAYQDQEGFPDVVLDPAGHPYLAWYRGAAGRLSLAAITSSLRLGRRRLTLSPPGAADSTVAIAGGGAGLAVSDVRDHGTNRVEAVPFRAPTRG